MQINSLRKQLTSFRIPIGRIGYGILGALYFLSIFGGFLAPYNHRSQAKETPYLPPVKIHFIDQQGHFYLRPFIYRPQMTDRLIFAYEENRAEIYPLRFFTRGESYDFLGLIPSTLHLVGTSENSPRFHVLGTDELGRDVLARLLYAGQISLLVGPLGLLLAYLIGVGLGVTSGYVGGWLDSVLMRAAEIVMSLPLLILILAFRAAFPLSVSPQQVMMMIIAIFAAIGWAEVARLTRNLALAEKGRDYIVSAISLGSTSGRVIFRHLLPNIATPLLTQFALTAPVFMLAEVTLSFLGVGVQEPNASWGTMLAVTKDISVLKNYWWMLAPVVCVFLAALAFQLIAETAKKSE